MRISFKRLTAVGVVILLPFGAAQAQGNDTFRQLELFGDIFERVRNFYVDDTLDEELIETAINGMLSALDPHSSYLNEKTYRDMQVQTRGEFGGLGIEVTMEQGLIRVVSPIDETPAANAGLRAGDFITHLDGEQVLGLTLSDAVEKMRGRVDSDITLTIRREGEDPFDVTLTRDVVKIQSVRGRVEGDVGYVRISTFNEQTMGGLEREVADIREELGSAMMGLVIDLRNNPGGLLDQAVKVSDAFLERGEIVSTRGRDDGEASRFNATPGDLAGGLPIAVLINEGSASASEIVAGALQDHRRAVLLGTRSFGKGSVQTIVPIPGHGAMRLTTARYYTPSGRSIQATGIEPDILVEQARIEPLDSVRRTREADLPNALDEDRDAEDQEEFAQGNDLAPDDYQLARAIDLLHGISLYSARVVN